MATVKVKFRPSIVAGKAGTIFYQIIHKRVIRQITTDYHIYPDEWDTSKSWICNAQDHTTERHNMLEAIRHGINRDLRRIAGIVAKLEDRPGGYSADDIVSGFMSAEQRGSLSDFMRDTSAMLAKMGRHRTAEIYGTVLNSFTAFMNGADITPDELDADIVQQYEAYLLAHGLVRNTTSFYMRTLRAGYNRAVEKGLTTQRSPFRHVYTGIDKTVKRAIPLKVIKQIKSLDLTSSPTLDFARDMFMFSFYTRGMSFIDIAYLKHNDLRNGELTYCRHKTGQRLHVKWEKCMQQIVDKHPSINQVYLLPIIKNIGSDVNHRRQYRTALHLVNNKLKIIANIVGIDTNLTMYVSRHSWASAARQRNVPIAIISEGMGHESEATTQIYLASLDTSAVDKANENILKSL